MPLSYEEQQFLIQVANLDLVCQTDPLGLVETKDETTPLDDDEEREDADDCIYAARYLLLDEVRNIERRRDEESPSQSK